MFKSIMTGTLTCVLFFISGCQTIHSDQSNSSNPVKTKTSVLQFIPEDTAMYFVSESQIIHSIMNVSNLDHFMMMVKREVAEVDSQLIEVVFDAFEAMLSKEKAQKFGFATKGDSAFYFNGLFPVVKIAVADKQKVETQLTNLESYFDHTKLYEKNLDGQIVKWFKFKAFDVMYQVNDDFFTLVIGEVDLENKAFKQSFNPKGVTNSLLNSKTYMSDKQKYGFNNRSKFEINIQKITSSLVDPQSSLMGQQFARMFPDAQNQLKIIQSTQCKNELMSMASAMPRLVSGYTALDLKDEALFSKSTTVLEILNPEVTNILSDFVGHISTNAFSKESLVSVGLGLDVDHALSTYKRLTQLIKQTKFDCMPLNVMQMIVPSAPAELMITASTFENIVGLSASIVDFDIDFTASIPQFKFIDSVVAVSSQSPENLVSLINSLNVLKIMPLSPAGEPSMVESAFIPENIELFAAIKNNFLTLYSGEQGSVQASELLSEPLSDNALLSASFNFGKFFAKEDYFKYSLLYTKNDACNDRNAIDGMQIVASNRGAVATQLTFNDHGVELSTQSEMIKSNSPFNMCPE